MLSEKDKANAALTAEVLQPKNTIGAMQDTEAKWLAEQKAQLLKDAMITHKMTEEEATILAEPSTEEGQ